MSIFSMQEEKLLDQLRMECESCFKCNPLGHMTDRKVFGEGPISAPIMSISEAPGQQEWEQQSCYRGRTG